MQSVGSGNDADDTVVVLDPRYAAPVAEPRLENHLQRKLSFQALDNADDVASLRAGRHEVDDAEFPTIALDISFENECVPSVPLLVLAHSRRRPNSPPAVLVPPKERRHARIGVETRQTQPIDIRIARNQCGALHITNKAVVFDSRSHRYFSGCVDKVWRRLSRERDHIFDAAAVRKYVRGLIDWNPVKQRQYRVWKEHHELFKTADRVFVVRAACVDRSENDLIFQNDVAHPAAEIGRDGPSLSGYAGQNQNAIRCESGECAKGHFGNTYGLEDDVDFPNALRQVIQRRAASRNIVRTAGSDKVGPSTILGLARKNMGLDALSSKHHSAEEPNGPRSEDQATQPWDIETKTGMDCIEHVCRFGCDAERLDQNSDPFKNARNRYKKALLFDPILAEKAIGPNDPALAELSCHAKVLLFLPARQAARILTRAPYRRDDEIARTRPSHLGARFHNLGQSFVTEHELGGSGRRRAVLEGGDLAIRAADSNFECSEQHLRATRPGRYRSFHQTDALLLWNHDDGTHRLGGSMGRLHFPAPHRDAGRRPIPSENFQRQANDVVETCIDSRKVEAFEDHDAHPEENAVDLGTFIAAPNRQVIDSDHPNPALCEHPGRAQIKVGIVFDESVHIPTAARVVRAQQ